MNKNEPVVGNADQDPLQHENPHDVRDEVRLGQDGQHVVPVHTHVDHLAVDQPAQIDEVPREQQIVDEVDVHRVTDLADESVL